MYIKDKWDKRVRWKCKANSVGKSHYFPVWFSSRFLESLKMASIPGQTASSASWSTCCNVEPHNCRTQTQCTQYTSLSKCYLPAGMAITSLHQTNLKLSKIYCHWIFLDSPHHWTHIPCTYVYNTCTPPVCSLLRTVSTIYNCLDCYTSTRSVHTCTYTACCYYHQGFTDQQEWTQSSGISTCTIRHLKSVYYTYK